MSNGPLTRCILFTNRNHPSRIFWSFDDHEIVKILKESVEFNLRYIPIGSSTEIEAW